MPYPAQGVVSSSFFDGKYRNCVGTLLSAGQSIPVSTKYNIHDASGSATKIKGFKLCRPWNHTFGRYTTIDAGTNGGSHLRQYTAGGQDCAYPISGAHAWASSGNNFIIGTTPDLPSGGIIDATLTRALNKLKDQDFHLGNFAAEAHKTLEMVGSHANNIAQQVNRFRSKNPRSWEKVKKVQKGRLPRQFWHQIPSAWLELQYGWKPLMSDVYGALHHLTRLSRYTLPYVYVTAHSSNVKDVSHVISLNGGPIFLNGTLTAKMSYIDKQDVYVNLVYGLNNLTLAELSSLGLINPFEILWETTRYSFVVDWFLPIGGWLSALTADVGWTFVTGTLSLISRRRFAGSTVTGSWPASVSAPLWVDKYTYPSVPVIQSTVGVMHRTCYGSSPVPGLYVKNPLSFDHVANGLSLLVQAFR